MAQQHKASLLLQKHGKLEVTTRQTPVPQGGQALVKVTAAAVNPLDWKIIDYGLFIENFPAVIGFDGAGIIHAVGPEVTGFQVGDRVLFQGKFSPADQAVYQEFAIVETDIITKTPDHISDDQASTFPTTSITAYNGLFQKTGIAHPLNGPTASGKSILILGGTIQLARIAGFSHIVTTASSQHANFLKSLGATQVLDRDASVETIQSAFPAPVALVFDTVSIDSTQSLAFDVLTTPSPVPGARLSVLLNPVDPLKKKNAEGKIVVDHIFGSSQMPRDLRVSFWKQVGQWIEQGELVPNRVQLVNGGLAGIPAALDLSRKGVSGVKLVIRPWE
ncbi:unnamed protein product [Rhizoctonia solani]|uniref:Enoyl reductase (ER) domain-containing protein n=1 Tax=Rhizoctonia solani TaxID=456999 RepID=A0A8H3BIE2_9AGAM|nr:unnamed protein product [Rhizoctonia solani]